MAAMLRDRPGDALRAAAWAGQALAPSCRWEGAILHVTLLCATGDMKKGCADMAPPANLQITSVHEYHCV